MTNAHLARRITTIIATLVAVAVVSAWIGLGSGVKPQQLQSNSQAALRRPAGYPQLVSMEPLPVIDGQMCEWDGAPSAGASDGRLARWGGGTFRRAGVKWIPASSNVSLASYQNEQLAAGVSALALDEKATSVDVDRAPVRIIRDTDPIYSSIAVDNHFDEVILQDANLFGIRVFNRLDNTPASAKFTEPKRVIEGDKTKLEFNCGLYVDPKTGDIYSVEQDTGDRMIVFPHAAKGNVAPSRQLVIPHRGYAIAVDEEKQELYLTVQYPPKVVVFRKEAAEDEKPLRILEGPRTRLADVHGIAIDVKNHLMFVNNHGSDSDYRVAGSGQFRRPSINVYPLDASGDTAPLRVIEGPKTQLDWPAAMSLDPDRGELFVANDAGDSVLVFRTSDSGDVAPARVVKGSKTGLKNPTGVFANTDKKELWVSNMGNPSATVYPLEANGNVAPLRTIRSAPAGKLSLKFGKPGAVAFDSKREEILVPN